MKQYIMMTVILLLILGCTKDADVDLMDDSASDEDSSEFDDLIEELEDKESLQEDDITATDSDDDGEDDTFEYTYEKEQVDDDLYVQKTLTMEKTDGGYDAEIAVALEGEGTYLMVLPKSFAAHVDDLEFSTEPSRIVNPDPEVEFLINRTLSMLIVKSNNAATKAGQMAAGLEALQGNLLGAEDIGKEVGISTFVGEVLANFDDVKAAGELALCKKETKEFDKQACLILVVTKNPHLFSKDDCNQFQSDGEENAYTSACLAITTNDIKHCVDYGQENNELYGDTACAAYAYLRYHYYCLKLSEKDQDACHASAAVITKFKKGCFHVKDKTMEKICHAKVSGRSSYCQEIEDKDARKGCCNLLELKGRILEKCVGPKNMDDESEEEDEEEIDDEPSEPLEDIPEEQEDSDDFRSRSSTCPYPVPDEAVWVERTYGDNQGEGWQVDGKWVGEVKNYRDKEKTIYRTVVCYKDGLKHGPQKTYNAEGKQLTDYNHKDGKADGDWIVYHANGQMSSKVTWGPNGYVGKTNSWYDDGSIHSEGNWIDGERHGEFNSYYQDGSPSMKQEYDMGKQTLYQTFKQK